MSTQPIIVCFRVTLKNGEPVVMRRLEVSIENWLDGLHLVLQRAMGWKNAHLYEFMAGGMGWGLPDPDFDDG